MSQWQSQGDTSSCCCIDTHHLVDCTIDCCSGSFGVLCFKWGIAEPTHLPTTTHLPPPTTTTHLPPSTTISHYHNPLPPTLCDVCLGCCCIDGLSSDFMSLDSSCYLQQDFPPPGSCTGLDWAGQHPFS